jgi:hypothetical protein
VAKATKSSEAYVYYVRWTDKKGKTAPKKKKSKIVKAVEEVKQALDVIEKPTKLFVQPQYKDAALKLLGMKEADLVNHPPHYKAGGVETIDFIEAKDLNYRLGNVVKYVSRAGKKVNADPVQDLEKAMFYLKREIDVRKSA